MVLSFRLNLTLSCYNLHGFSNERLPSSTLFSNERQHLFSGTISLTIQIHLTYLYGITSKETVKAAEAGTQKPYQNCGSKFHAMSKM